MGEAIASSAVDVCSLAQPYAESSSGKTMPSISNSNDGLGAGPPIASSIRPTPLLQRTVNCSPLPESLAPRPKDFYGDFDAAIKDLQPIYGAPRRYWRGVAAPSAKSGDRRRRTAGIRNGVEISDRSWLLEDQRTDESSI